MKNTITINGKKLIFPEQKQIALAPMAGITDKPMRQLAQQFGATWTVGEMLTSIPHLQHTRKSLQRRNHAGETGIVVMQLAGSDPEQMAKAAQDCVQFGAKVIDINMGCPAKKVCQVESGSALMKNEVLVSKILNAVVQAVEVPVTLKTRLGWDDDHQNVLSIAKIAEESGIAALAIHGRTRTQMYRGKATYDLIAEVKSRIDLPLWVNGDIDSAQKAEKVLQETGADGVMIGRAAQGQPWLFAEIAHYLHTKTLAEPITFQAATQTILEHLRAIYDFYGQHGVRVARKHIGYYFKALPDSEAVRRAANLSDDRHKQWDLIHAFLEERAKAQEYWLIK